MSNSLSFYSDSRDVALIDATPIVAAPIYGTLTPVAIDTYRFVMAADGLYIEARSRALAIRSHLTTTFGMPYGWVFPMVDLVAAIPASMHADVLACLQRQLPNEGACGVVFNHDTGAYELVEPVINHQSSSHIDYQRIAEDASRTLVVDVHSHGHHEAYFSEIDDDDDIDGIYLAVVFGFDGSKLNTPSHVTRLVIYGHQIDVDWLPWEVQ